MFSPLDVQGLLACATCMGDAGHATVLAANSAIFLMLAMLALVLGSIISFIVYLARRARGQETQVISQ